MIIVLLLFRKVYSFRKEGENRMKDIKIIVATHKKYRMPDDDMYIPVHVGAQGKELLGYIPDNTGENISNKNPYYCELTGLYWAWKNLDYEYLGMCHYRRYFSKSTHVNKKDIFRNIYSKDDLNHILNEYDLIIPKKRNYYIESNYTQYAHAHNKIDLDVTRDIINDLYPEYLNAFDESMKISKGHKFNMFIMKKELIDNYCIWLFSILFELEKRLDISNYSVNDQRVFGFASERLLDVWIQTNELNYKELKVCHLEGQNWPKKTYNFLKRKFIIRH